MSQTASATRSLLGSQLSSLTNSALLQRQPASGYEKWALQAAELTDGVIAYAQTGDSVGPHSVLESVAEIPEEFLLTLDGAIARGAVGTIARSLAIASYAAASEGWAAGRPLRDASTVSASLPRRMSLMADVIRTAWRQSRRIARSGKREPLIALAHDLVEANAQLPQLCADAAAAPWAAQSQELAPGLLVSQQARELALLLAAIPYLHARLGEPRLIKGTQGIAERRTQLVRRDGPPGRATGKVPPLPTGRTAAVRGVVAETGWIERPESPFGYARLVNDTILVLPFKRFRTRGVLPGSVIWAAGKVKASFHDLGRVLEIEAEGPGSHADTVWKDWLSTELRDALDIAPGSLRLFWEMPDPAERLAARDFTAHLPNREVVL